MSFYEPLRDLIKSAVKGGFIQERNAGLITFVDGPSDPIEHESFDWGAAALDALDEWQGKDWKGFGYDWTKRKENCSSKEGKSSDPMDAV